MEETLIKLVSIMNDFQKNKIENYQELQKAKKEVHSSIVEILKSEIERENNNERLQKYLENTKISDLNFLYRSLVYMRGNNQNGSLTTEKLFFLNEEARNIAKSYNVNTESKLFNVLVEHQLHNKVHPLLTDKTFIDFWNNAHTLAYLDEFFKDINNCLAYQGAYTTYKYVKRYLKETLTIDNPEDDQKLVYKNLNSKLNIVTENLIPIANEMLSLRNNIPESRISVCNQGLKRTANKKENTPVSFEQQIFINAIAFGTTLEKLEAKNYEDAKQLLYLPHQKIIK